MFGTNAAAKMVVDEPVLQYERIFKGAHDTNVKSFLDDLIEKHDIDRNKNRETVAEIKLENLENDKISRSINFQTQLRKTLIFVIVFVSVVFILVTINVANFGFQKNNSILCIGAGSLSTLLILLDRLKIRPRLNDTIMKKDESDARIESLKEKAWEQLSPINNHFYDGMCADLFSKTIPLITVDRMFDNRRFDCMVSNFGLDVSKEKNRSTLFVQSGEMNGNPFFFCDDLVQEMGEETYTGSLRIRWKTKKRVGNRVITKEHTQTLRARVTKPKPYYYEEPYLVFANEAAPDLTFSRKRSYTHDLSGKERESTVQKISRKLAKASSKSIFKGENYTTMGNSEFEVLWGAHDRDQEVQFRLLFTPLAQNQLTKILKDSDIGYGDDFDFYKVKKINYVHPEHLEEFEVNVKPEDFMRYDMDELYSNFVHYNHEFFKHIYFTFAPIFAIPIYQQTVTKEYIYKDLYDSYVSFYEHEKVVNRMNPDDFNHPDSATHNILKTKLVKSENHTDTVEVTSHGFAQAERIDYVRVRGGDGRTHRVPVHWIEYIPVEQTREVEIIVDPSEEGDERTPQERIRAMFECLKKRDVSREEVVLVSTFLARLINKE